MTAMTEPSTTRSEGSSPERDDLVLDVRDLAGNPIDPDLRYEDEFAPFWTVQP